jgi:hypothetical protein
MQVWHAQAQPLLENLIKAEDDLLSVSEAPAVVVIAYCDQLEAAIRHAQMWLQDHRCPDQEFGIYFFELLSACLGLSAVMQYVSAEEPEGRWIGNQRLVDMVGGNLMDRIEQARKARNFLLLWTEELPPVED